MTRVLTRTIGLAIAAGSLAVLAHSSALASPPAGEDFNAGNAENWQPEDPLKDTFGPTAFEIDNGAYRITTQPLPPIPQILGAGSWFIPSSVDPDSYSDGTVRIRVRFHNEATNAGFYMRATGSGGEGTGYIIFLNNFQDFIGIADIAAGGGNIAGTGFPLDVGVDYMVEGRTIGSEISIKVWVHGEPEPTEPQVSITDSLYPDGGLVALIVYNQPSHLGGTGGVLDASFDDFSFTPQGSDLIDDFVDGADGWSTIDNMGPVGGGSFAVVDSEYHIGSAKSLPADMLYWAAAASDETYLNPQYRNGVARTKFTLHNGQTNVMLLMRDSGQADEGSFYGFYANKANPNFDAIVGIARWVNGTSIWEEALEIPMVVGNAYYLEAVAIGDEFSIKVWAATEEEPEDPQVSLTDVEGNDLETGIALVVYNQSNTPGQLSASFSNVWYTPDAPSSCPADLTGDGNVGVPDLLALLAAWGPCPDGGDCPGDLTGSGSVGVPDLLELLSQWGACP